MLISKMKQEYLANHNSHPSPLLSRSCRTECAVWHSYTWRTPLLWDLWWTRLLPSGRPVSPKQTAINHSDSTNYKRKQSWSPLCSHRNWWSYLSSVVLINQFHIHGTWWLTGLVWTVDSSSNLTVAEVMTLMMSSHVWPTRGWEGGVSLQLITSSNGYLYQPGAYDYNDSPHKYTHWFMFSHTFYLISILHLWGLLHLTSSQSRGEKKETVEDSVAQTAALKIHSLNTEMKKSNINAH